MKGLILFFLVFSISCLGNAQERQAPFAHLEQFFIKDGVALHGEEARLARWEDQRRIIALMKTDLRGDPMDLPQGDAPSEGQQYQSSHLGTAFVQPESERPQGNYKGYNQGYKGFSPPPPEAQPLIATTPMPPPPTRTPTTTTKAPCQSLLTPPPTPPPCPNRITTPAPYDPPCARSEYSRNFRSQNNQYHARPHLGLQDTVNALEGHDLQTMLKDQPITTTIRTIHMEPARFGQQVRSNFGQSGQPKREETDGKPEWLQEGSALSAPPPRSAPTLLLYNSFFKNDNMGHSRNEMERSPKNALQRRGRTTGRRWRNHHSRRQ